MFKSEFQYELYGLIVYIIKKKKFCEEYGYGSSAVVSEFFGYCGGPTREGLEVITIVTQKTFFT